MLTRTEYKLSKSELAERYFTCKHCGAAGEVAFGTEGTSGWQADGLLVENIHEIVAREAELDLRTDAMRTQALIPCPTCGRRAAGAARWAGLRVGFWIAAGMALVLVGGVEVAMGAAGCGVMAIWQGWRERGRFKRAGRATILKLQPGKLPDAEVPRPRPAVRRQLAPPPDLPRARVVAAPAPVVAEAPDPTAPPKFLVDGDKAR